MSPKDHGFDWVTVRSECSLAVQFERLKADVEKNVEDRNDIVGKVLGFEFKKNSLFFTVVRTSAKTTRWVTFQLSPPEVMGGTSDRIQVVDEDKNELFRIALTLNSNGDCRYKIAEDDGPYEGEYLRWQVLRRALEPLFF